MRQLLFPCSRRWLGGALLVLAGLAGCGGSTPPTSPTTAPENPAAPAPASTTGAPASATISPGDASALVQVKNGQKWIGDVPLDVWFNDPYGEASNTQAVATATTSLPMPTATAPQDTPEPEKPAEPMATGPDWKAIITGQVIDNEVTQIRNRLNGELQTLGKYNTSYLALPPHLATLAVMAGIAKEHPDDIRWKERAGYIMQLAAQMNAEKLRSGASSYRPLKEQFDFVVEVLSGSIPPALEEPPADQTIPDSTDFGNLMKRLEVAANYIKVNGGTADAMKEKTEDLKHEAMVLGALSAVLNREGFGYEGDPGFDEYVNTMVESSLEMRTAIDEGQFEKFELGVSKMFQACQECHSSYRG